MDYYTKDGLRTLADAMARGDGDAGRRACEMLVDHLGGSRQVLTGPPEFVAIYVLALALSVP